MKTYNLSRKQKFISKNGTKEEIEEMIEETAKDIRYTAHEIIDHALLVLYEEGESDEI